MKAICIHNLHDPLLIVESGDVVDYTVKDKKFIVRGVAMPSTAFFNHFKVTESIDKMSYSDFKYILCNYVFRMGILSSHTCGDGEYYLIIEDWDKKHVHISINEKDNAIHVSFNYGAWELYESYEDALEGIRSHR